MQDKKGRGLVKEEGPRALKKEGLSFREEEGREVQGER